MGDGAAMKTIQRGERIPLGLSKRRDLLKDRWQFRMPVFVWYGLHYDPTSNAYHRRWRALNFLLKTNAQGFDFRRGWALLKETAQTVLPVARDEVVDGERG
jgi:hypothetical protein